MLLALALAISQAKFTVNLGGEQITVEVPSWSRPGPRLATADIGGVTYGFDGGRLVSTGGGWDAVRTPVPVAPGAAKTTVLFQLLSHLDVQTDEGYLRQRQADIYSDDVRAMKREAALFCYLVQQSSNGKLQVDPTWRVDDTLQFMNGPGEPWSEFSVKYLGPLVNATQEKPSEGPGPFQTTLLLHPGFQRSMPIATLDGKPIVSVPVYAYFDRARPGQLARAMFEAWVSGLASKSGALAPRAGVGDGPIELDDPADWSASGPLGSLPGVTKPELDEPSAATERGAFLAGDSLLVRAKFAKAFLPKYKATGWTAAAGELWVVFDKGSAQSSMDDAALLGVQPSTPTTEAESTELAFDPGQAEKLPVSGSFAAATVADPERGSVGEIREIAIRRAGWVRLLGSFDSAKTPFLEFMFKPRSGVWPVNVVVQGDGWTKVYRLFGKVDATPGLPGAYDESGAIDLALKPEATWQKVVLDLRAGHPGGKVLAVYLAAPAHAGSAVQSHAVGAPALLFDDLSVRAEATAAVTPIGTLAPDPAPAADAENPIARAKFAHTTSDQAVLLKLLDDPAELVRWNAADRFRTFKNPLAVPKLTEIGGHYNPRLAQAGSLALGNQGTEIAYAALRYNFQRALGDFSKQFGAQVLPAINERKILAELAVGLNARRPEARCEVVRCLGRQPFKEAPLVMMTFLNDLDPSVRIAVLESLPSKDGTVLSRVIGEARNDPSDAVRVAAFKRLKEWGAPEASEAVKDPSPRVRAGS